METNCQTTKEGIEQRISIKAFKYWKVTSAFRENEVFALSWKTYRKLDYS